MSRFTITGLPLAGLKRIDRQRSDDTRGYLSRLFCAEELVAAGWLKPVAQITHTHTVRSGTVRGLHFQLPPHAEMKLVSCIRGRVFDVAVDLRRGSHTFGRWHSEVLDVQDGGALLVPEGFAHGFQALCDDVELLYCHSAAHIPGAEAGVNVRDEHLGIAWPLPIAELSPRDTALPFWRDAYEGVQL